MDLEKEIFEVLKKVTIPVTDEEIIFFEKYMNENIEVPQELKCFWSYYKRKT